MKMEIARYLLHATHHLLPIPTPCEKSFMFGTIKREVSSTIHNIPLQGDLNIEMGKELHVLKCILVRVKEKSNAKGGSKKEKKEEKQIVVTLDIFLVHPIYMYVIGNLDIVGY